MTMKRYMHLFLVLLLLSGQEGKAQLQRQDVVTAMERANDYFLRNTLTRGNLHL